MIRNMKEEGTSNREIVKELGISMNTMSKMLKTNRVKEYQSRKRGSKLDPYREKIKEFIGKYNLSSVRILEEIRRLGYDGGYTIRKDRRIHVKYLDYRGLEGMARSVVGLGIMPRYGDYTTIWNRIHDKKPDLDISGLEYAEIGTDGRGDEDKQRRCLQDHKIRRS